jgi:hypothetical protein
MTYAFAKSPLSPLLLVMLATACGGAGVSGAPAKGPGDASGGGQDGKESIGDLAAAQGGLGALGGNGNRDDSGATGTEVAMGGTLRADEVEKQKPVKVDGVLKEWPARAPMRETISGKTEGLALDIGVQYDDARLYVGADVTDPKPQRSGKHDASDDHVRIVLAFPSGRGALKAYEIGLWAGKSGESAGAVKWLSGPQKGQEVAGAKIVENDAKGGYTLEAAIPWSTFAEARTMRVGLRAAFRYHDGDGGVIGNGKGGADKPGELPPLPSAAEQAVVDGLLTQKNLAGEPPKIDVYADVAGDERKERVSVFGRFFTICGPGYRGGHQFFWRESAGDITSLEARDVTGRGKDDLVVRRRITVKGSVRETVEVWSLAGGDEPVTVFAHESAVASSDGKQRVTNAVRVSAKEIEVAIEPAVGWDAKSYSTKDGSPSDTEPVLLPWGTVKSRTFKFEGGRFAKASEVTQAGVAAQATEATAATATGPTGPARTRDVPTPASKPAPADLGKQVLEAFYRDAGVTPSTKPRFDLEVNVDGDGRAERVLLVGREIVVLGPGFKGGTGYVRMSLSQFEGDKDVSELTVRDVTGDGAAEILIRGVRRVAAASGDKVDVEGLFIYQVKGGALTRVLAIETGRELGGKRVQGLVQFVPAKVGRGFDVDVRPGIAKGWTQKTYPWPQDKPGSAIEPLLLPWSTIKALRYSWNGSQFATAP